MARVARYLRRSTHGDEDKNASIDVQRQHIMDWVAANGHTHVDEYKDVGGDSWQIDGRHDLERLLDDAERGLFDIVAVYDIDRWTRHQADYGELYNRLRACRVRVADVCHPDYGDDALAYFMTTARVMAAQIEREQIQTRTNRGKRARVQKGRLLPTAFPLYGYVWADPDEKHGKSRFLPDVNSIDDNPAHAAAAVVRRIYHTVLYEGATIRALTGQLSAEGVPTPSQVYEARKQRPSRMNLTSLWSASTVWRILSNPAYIGQHAAYRRQHVSRQVRDERTGKLVRRAHTVARQNPDELIAYPADTCPPLISPEDFVAVQAHLTANKAEAARNHGAPHMVLLRGYATCGYCGQRMGSVHRADGSYRYFCRSRTAPRAGRTPCPGGAFSWNTAEADAKTWDFVEQLLQHPEMARKRLEQQQARDTAIHARALAKLDGYKAQLAEAETFALRSDEAMLRAESERERAYYQARARQHRDTADELRTRLESVTVACFESERVVREVQATLLRLAGKHEPAHTYSYEERRQWLRDLGVHVTMRRKGSGPDALEFSCDPATDGASVSLTTGRSGES